MKEISPKLGSLHNTVIAMPGLGTAGQVRTNTSGCMGSMFFHHFYKGKQLYDSLFASLENKESLEKLTFKGKNKMKMIWFLSLIVYLFA